MLRSNSAPTRARQLRTHWPRPTAMRPVAAWRRIESAIVEYFRAEGGEIFAVSGESYVVVNRKYLISLSDLARQLSDPTS